MCQNEGAAIKTLENRRRNEQNQQKCHLKIAWTAENTENTLVLSRRLYYNPIIDYYGVIAIDKNKNNIFYIERNS